MGAVKEDRRPIFSCWLTREEWKMVYAYSWVARVLRCYGLEDCTDEEWKKVQEEGVAMLWATRKLALRHKMKFTAVEVTPAGLVRLTTLHPIEPRNAIYVERMTRGKGPHYAKLIEDALLFAHQKELVNFDAEPMRAALSEIHKDMAHQQAQVSEEEQQEYGDALRRMLSSVGVVMGGPDSATKLREDN